jgi:TetR/AcrR family transcriptional repressor of nem operon
MLCTHRTNTDVIASVGRMIADPQPASYASRVGRPQVFDTDEVIDMAMHLFWEHGYARTTPQMLTDELGIGKGSLYHSFGSKHNLFTLALQRYYDNRVNAITQTLSGKGPVLPRLRKIMIVLTGVGGHRRGCFIVNTVGELANPDERVARAATDLFDMITAEFTSAIERGRGSGEFVGQTDPPKAARELLATMIGISVLAKVDSDHRKLLRAIDEALDALAAPSRTTRAPRKRISSTATMKMRG